jgi:DNA polymerase-3 subunit epsilon
VDLASAPPLREVAPELRAVLADRFVVTWVQEIELGFLRGVFGGSPRAWRRRTLDACRLHLAWSKLHGAEARPLSLAAATERAGLPVGTAHHALDDALMTAHLFLVLATRLEAEGRRRFIDLWRLAGRRTGRRPTRTG